MQRFLTFFFAAQIEENTLRASDLALAAILLSSTAAAGPQDKTVVGQWMSVTGDSGSGTIMSFRSDDHSVRVLVPVSSQHDKDLASMPADKQQLVKSQLFVDPQGKRFVEMDGTWSQHGRSVHISVRAPDGSPVMNLDAVPRFVGDNAMQLLVEGKRPDMMAFVGPPLPQRRP